MNRKRILTIILMTVYFTLTGYTFSTEAPYIDVNCSLGNNIKIYLPEDKIEYIKIEGNNIINISSGIIYGYTENNRVAFPVFDNPYYVVSYTNVDLAVSSINEVHFYVTATDYLRKDPLIYIFMLVGGIFVWQILTSRS